MDRRTSLNPTFRNLPSGRLVFRVLFGLSVLLNLYLLFFRGPATESTPAAAPTPAGGIAVADVQPNASPAPAQAEVAAPAAAVTTDSAGSQVAESAGKVVDADSGLRVATLDVRGSFSQTFVDGLGADIGPLVSAVFSRIFVWRLDLRADLRKGDKLEMVYRVLPSQNQADIRAARYHSTKNSIVYQAYWYKAPGRPYPSYYDEKGVEIALTLTPPVMDGYEQITSLLKDRIKHKGIDFKCAVGAKVFSPYRGRVTRTNWARPNGNCVEVEFTDSKILAKFLHLDRIQPGIEPGKQVAAGEFIATAGNTGHSTNPHLHYQLEKPNGTVVDPLEFHKTHNETLPPGAMADFSKVVQQWSQHLTL